MEQIKIAETKYLRAKIAYYEGNPLMTDSEFNFLEQFLINAGSKVVEQVGSKRKDFDFEHPTKMLSLRKFQTEKYNNGDTNYMINDFQKWFQKRMEILKRAQYYSNNKIILFASPKFDGSAINIIYHNGFLYQVLTRGDGEAGKDITKRFIPLLPNFIDCNCKYEDGNRIELEGHNVFEIRCEVVINKNLFDKKYKGTKEEGKFANPRNYVAGVLGKDDYNKIKVSELSIQPLHFIQNGKQQSKYNIGSDFYKNLVYQKTFRSSDYKSIIQFFENIRDKFEYPLDGVVLSFETHARKFLGENNHDPEWSVAIKFVSEEIITSYEGLELNISKRGEIVPVVLMKPVQLAGTTVKRASGYNMGFIVKNQIGPGSSFSVIKAGEIIPEIQNVVIPSTEKVELITHCPFCSSLLTFDNIHLKCNNEICSGRNAKKLASAAAMLDLKNIGNKTLVYFSDDFTNMFELMKWVLTEGKSDKIINYGIKYNSRSHEIFVNAFTSIQSLPYAKVIIMLGYDNVGRKISEQLALEHAGLEHDYASLEKALVLKLHEPEIEVNIKNAVKTLEDFGIKIDRPILEIVSTDTKYVCMTGSPKTFGFKTKSEFLNQFTNVIEVSLSDKKCQYLITDDYNSTSNKMKTATKRGIIIKTYEDFKK